VEPGHWDCWNDAMLLILGWIIKDTLWLFNLAMENGPFFLVYLLKMVIFHGYVK
jgi:hypothetical protein